ncbi:MAG: glycogen/starch/alpha-glucan phosphorylase [Clostridia bacterium]|nr:glycogen/starch/alpha-glucan phosphorylase [Clostridia bacterium]
MHLTKENFKRDFKERLEISLGTQFCDAADTDIYLALGGLVRKYITSNWMNTNERYRKSDIKQVYYFSMEFLLGRQLESNLINLGILDICKEGLADLDIDFDTIKEVEKDPGLGVGGLGRLAACFLDSMASLEMPGHGFGIRYKHGCFQQKILDGYQIEMPDDWLSTGFVWEVKEPGDALEIRFGGKITEEWTKEGLKIHHEGYESILAVPYDIPIVGYNNNTVNTLRLWGAKSMQKEFDFALFDRDRHMEMANKNDGAETISQTIYPDISDKQGRLLRLKQQYFLSSAGIQSIVKSFKEKDIKINCLDKYIAIQINDTHPALVIPELMRILVDIEGLDWDDAWGITTGCVAYTNHTIMPEGLEKWPIHVFKGLLPRIYRIVEEINERFCRNLWGRYTGDWDKISRMAIIADGYVNMAHLAVVGSKSVNGVSKIHSEILKKQVMLDFYNHSPLKFNNKTNGITHRRWLLKANPKLSHLITDSIGPGWKSNPMDLVQLKKYKQDQAFLEELDKIKLDNKRRLAKDIQDNQNINVDPQSIFDIHVKRIHAYKRQLLNIMNVINLYNHLKEREIDIMPRTFIFGGKAAPGYTLAKQIVKLINSVADKINKDKTTREILKVVFIENYRVSNAEIIIPAADVSQQISTTTKEASGTGNMKFMMNGAITIGTMDGANVELAEAVGEENMIIFGLTKEEVMDYYTNGGYDSMEVYNKDKEIKKIITQMRDGTLSPNYGEFDAIIYSLLEENDQFFVLKDFHSYTAAQNRINNLFKDKDSKLRMALQNIAASGIFSSDRTIGEYAEGIWGL